MSERKKTSGNFSAQDKGLYFLAADFTFFKWDAYPNVLIPIDVIRDSDIEALERMHSKGIRVMIDSGVYSFVTRLARSEHMTFADVLKIPVTKLDGFDLLVSNYLMMAHKIIRYVWGIVEIDLGGEVGKVETRKRIEDSGIVPMPVYHCFVDSLEYGAGLMESYDRICVGNIVDASRAERLRILEKLRRVKPDECFAHLLGYSIDPVQWAYGFDSCDTSTWLSNVRWAQLKDRACFSVIGAPADKYIYRLKNNDQWNSSVRLSQAMVNVSMLNYEKHRECVA